MIELEIVYSDEVMTIWAGYTPNGTRICKFEGKAATTFLVTNGNDILGQYKI